MMFCHHTGSLPRKESVGWHEDKEQLKHLECPPTHDSTHIVESSIGESSYSTILFLIDYKDFLELSSLPKGGALHQSD